MGERIEIPDLDSTEDDTDARDSTDSTVSCCCSLDHNMYGGFPNLDFMNPYYGGSYGHPMYTDYPVKKRGKM
jgi:hypothetical protein